jgi:hypothetical protein
MMRSIFIGTILGTLGIGGAAIAQDAFSPPRPVQGVGVDGAPNQRAVPGVPGAANKRDPAGQSGASPTGKKGRMTWPEGVATRVKTMHQKIVGELDLTPRQSKALQALMIEKGAEFKARKSEKRASKGAQGKGPKAGKGPQGQGKRPMAADGADRPKRPGFAAGERPTPPGR